MFKTITHFKNLIFNMILIIRLISNTGFHVSIYIDTVLKLFLWNRGFQTFARYFFRDCE